MPALRREVRVVQDPGDTAMARGHGAGATVSLEPSLPTPELVDLSKDAALVVTRLVAGVPLSWEWASSMSAQETTEVAQQIAAFLVRLHGADIGHLLGDLPEVHPTAQADTETLRRRFPRLIDDGRGASVMVVRLGRSSS